MKKGIIGTLVILLCVTAGVLVSSQKIHVNWFKSEVDTHLSIIYPDKQHSAPLTDKEKQYINSCFKKHIDKYQTASLYIDQYSKREITGDSKCSNYQLIITARDGCVIESKPIYTSRRLLAKSIGSKVDKLIDEWWRLSEQTSGHPKKLTKISNI